MRVLAALLILATGGTALAQGVATRMLAGHLHVSLDDIGARLGQAVTAFGSSLTVRSGFGNLTLWLDSREALWLPQGAVEPEILELPFPVHEAGDTLWAPVEVLTLMEATISGQVVIMPDRTRLVLALPAAAADIRANPEPPDSSPGATAPPADGLSGDAGAQPGAGSGPGLPGAGLRDWEPVRLENSVPGLRLYSGSQSLLLLDMGLLGLAFPESRAQFDAFLAQAGTERPLYFVLTSSEHGPWDARFEFSQDGLNTVAEPPYDVVLLEGDLESVGPGATVSGVILLPSATNLRQPLQVEWQQVTAQIVFRR